VLPAIKSKEKPPSSVKEAKEAALPLQLTPACLQLATLAKFQASLRRTLSK
jgi:hypothetical protein